MTEDPFQVTILDYGAGNVRSLRNAVKHLGYNVKDAVCEEDIANAEVILFPGQGCFHQAMQSLRESGLILALKKYILDGRPFFGICLGMQLLFEGSEESPGVEGLGIIPGMVTKFNSSFGTTVPQIGWNGLAAAKQCSILTDISQDDKAYFVHSYCALPSHRNIDWVLTVTDYGHQRFISTVQKGNIVAAQFHPEKSGSVGLQMINNFLSVRGQLQNYPSVLTMDTLTKLPSTVMANRIIACLDVRSNDAGDLVVTKGDQYDVRESDADENNGLGRGCVRNLGKPVALCKRYFDEGADEIVFLNITSFRQGVVDDLPMLQVLEASSENVFVPLTVGGGIREYVDEAGREYSALEVVSRYFRAGADKVSIGSDAVYAAEEYLRTREKSGRSSIEQISSHYGAQAVVVSIDPKRVYINELLADDGGDDLSRKTVVELPISESGPNGERYCWWQTTVKGGREYRDIDAVQLARICEILGAGEIMLNCIDMDGQCNGYDLPLVSLVQKAVTIPVIASSGAGNSSHFVEVFEKTPVRAALAAGMFHRQEVSINEVKTAVSAAKIPVRLL